MARVAFLGALIASGAGFGAHGLGAGRAQRPPDGGGVARGWLSCLLLWRFVIFTLLHKQDCLSSTQGMLDVSIEARRPTTSVRLQTSNLCGLYREVSATGDGCPCIAGYEVRSAPLTA